MMGVYEAILVGAVTSLVIASFLRYLTARRILRDTEEICSRHRESMDTIFADMTEGIRASSRDAIERIEQHGEETRERIGQHAEKAIRSMNMEAEA